MQIASIFSVLQDNIYCAITQSGLIQPINTAALG